MSSDSKLRIPQASTVEWATPDWLFSLLHREFRFTVDAAASKEHHRLERYWTVQQNGLAQDWTGERVFCNPPYGAKELGAFACKAWSSSCIAALVVPVKADQGWWHDYALRSEIRFIKGRVSFGDADNCFPGPIAVLVFGTGRSGAYSLQTTQTEICGEG
jgi:site-specific DNA-methyltransferase (adenine-specific)